jgi:hypothetical protein
VFVQTSQVEVTLETLTIDRKFLINSSSDKRNQIVPEGHCPTFGSSECVSKQKDSPYRSGRSPDWLKMKNPEAPAV